MNSTSNIFSSININSPPEESSTNTSLVQKQNQSFEKIQEYGPNNLENLQESDNSPDLDNSVSSPSPQPLSRRESITESPIEEDEDAPPTPTPPSDGSQSLSLTLGGSTPSADPTLDRASHVSLLGGRYLLFAQPGQTGTSPARAYQKCVHVETRQQFACKVIPRDVNGLSVLSAYHRLDADCKCISQLHEVILAPRFIYLILPPNFGNVHSYILMKKRLREPEAINIFRQMVEVVQYCHEKGIVLRDLKMGKFVFTDKERTSIKLESLEDAVLLANIEDDGLSDKHGCPNYVSPEKAEILRSNRKYPGRKSDIWGLGVILFTMLVGRYPFNDPDHSRLFAKIRRAHLQVPEYLSTSAKCLIRCLLRKNSGERLSTGEILKHPWLSRTDPTHSSRINYEFCTNGARARARQAAAAAAASNTVPQNLNISINLSNLPKHGDPRYPQQNDDQVVPDFPL